MASLSYKERGELSSNEIAKKLFFIMDQKETNLGASIDVVKSKDILNLIKQIGHLVCLIKLHVDIIEDFDFKFVEELLLLAKEFNFLIFEDRKFADIGNTVSLQYSKGMYRISEWADIVNAHILPGEGIIKALRQIGQPKGRGLLLLAQMSSAGSMFTESYTNKTIELAELYSDFVFGFICTKKISDNPSFIHMTPGVSLINTKDGLMQQYQTPDYVIGSLLSDVILVGRGIYASNNPEYDANNYRTLGWNAYKDRIKKN